MFPEDQMTSTSSTFQQANLPSPLANRSNTTSPWQAFSLSSSQQIITPLEASSGPSASENDSDFLERLKQCKNVDALLAQAKTLSPRKTTTFLTYIKALENFYHHANRSKYGQTQLATKWQLIMSLARLGGVTADKFNEMEELILSEINTNKSAYVGYYYQALASLYQSYLVLSKETTLTSGKQTTGKVGAVDMRRSFKKLIGSMRHVEFLDDVHFPASAFLEALQAQFDVMDKVGVETLPAEFLKAMKVILSGAKLSKKHQTLDQKQTYHHLQTMYGRLQSIASGASKDAATRADSLYDAATHSVMFAFHLAGLAGSSNPNYFLLAVLDVTHFFKALGKAVLPVAITGRLANSKAWLMKQAGQLDGTTLAKWEQHRKQLTLDSDDAAFKTALKHYFDNKVHVCVEINLVNHLFQLLELDEGQSSETPSSLSPNKRKAVFDLLSHYFNRIDYDSLTSKVPGISKKLSVEPYLHARLLTGFYQCLQAIDRAGEEGKRLLALLHSSLTPATREEAQKTFLLWAQPMWAKTPLAFQHSLILTLKECYQLLMKPIASGTPAYITLFNAQLTVLEGFFDNAKAAALKGFIAKQVDESLGATGLSRWPDKRGEKFIKALPASEADLRASTNDPSAGKSPAASFKVRAGEIDLSQIKDIQASYLQFQAQPLVQAIEKAKEIFSNSERVKAFDENDKELYVPVQGQHSRFSESTDTFDVAHKNILPFIQGEQRVKLISARAGMGKTLFSIWFAKQVWKNWKTTGDPIPVYVPLSTLKNPYGDLVQESLSSLGFSQANIQTLIAQKQRFIFFLDGYDELGQSNLKNIYNTNEAFRTLDAKIIITTRYDGLPEGDYSEYFVPIVAGRKRYELYNEIFLSSFSEGQIKNYVETYCRVKPEQDRDYKTPQEYLGHIKTIPGLEELIKTPYALNITMFVLPELILRYENKPREEKWIKLERKQLYDEFIYKKFTRQKVKIINAPQAKVSGKEGKYVYEKKGRRRGLFYAYARDLSATIFNYNKKRVALGLPEEKNLITYPYAEEDDGLFDSSTTMIGTSDGLEASVPQQQIEKLSDQYFKQFFDFTQVEIEHCFRAAPIRKVGENQYAFWHLTLLEYFQEQAIYKSAKKLHKQLEQQGIIAKTQNPRLQADSTAEPTDQEPKPSTSGTSDQETVVTNDVTTP